MDTMSSGEALFALDTTMEEDMSSYVDEVTMLAIKHINSTPELYTRIKATIEQGASLQITAKWWAEEERHNNEFGDLFIAELDMVNWDEVRRRV